MTEFNIDGIKYQITEPTLEVLGKVIIYKEKGFWPFKKKVPMPNEELVESCRNYILKHSVPKLDVYSLHIEKAIPIFETLFAKNIKLENAQGGGMGAAKKKKTPTYIG